MNNYLDQFLIEENIFIMLYIYISIQALAKLHDTVTKAYQVNPNIR